MRKRSIAMRLGLVPAVLVLLGHAGADAATLKQALSHAYETNPDLLAERANLRSTDELVSQALSNYRPQIFLNGTLNETRGDAAVSHSQARQSRLLSSLTSTLGGGGAAGGGGGGGGQDSTTTIHQFEKSTSLTVRQNLYSGGGRTAQLAQARSQVSAESANLMASEQNTLLLAVEAYTNAWRDQAQLRLALNNEKVLRRQLDSVRNQFNVGAVARTDLAQAQARLSRGRADVETAKSNLAASLASYRQIIGQEPTNLADPTPLNELPGSLDEAQSIAAMNPNIAIATNTLRAADDAIRVASANLLPSLDLNASATAAYQPDPTTPWQKSASIGLNLSIPLYQGGAVYSQIRQGRETQQQRRNLLDSAVRSVAQQVSADWDAVLASRASVRAFQAATRANQVATDGITQEQRVGSRTVLDVLNTQQDLFTSQVNLVQTRGDLVVNTYALKAAVGQLTADALQLSAARYDESTYLRRNANRLFGSDPGK